ncbi:MMPL family transporter [Mycolicibacterium mengxianglii]|uniref:MMPL family transporter n=1 Tax=Mycolicibacterium mengxianglii TaxID=2736649 RepID=UPI0018D074C7|nr:MMPL family transporter [Mycolicibacterium mengxianglii]
MFAWWGRMVYRFRYLVIGVMVALCVGGGIYGFSLGQHVTQSGFYDEGSQSVHASLLADEAYGRDTSGHIVALYTAPEGKTVEDPAFQKEIVSSLDQLEKDHPDEVLRSIGYFKSPELLANMSDADKQHAFMSIQLKGDNDDTILNNYKTIEPDLLKVRDEGIDVQYAGLQPLAGELTGTIGEDQKRAEIAAIPLVAVVLFFVFGGVIAAALPAIIGGLSILGALGIMRLAAEFIPVHFFAQPVVTLIGLGIAIDYGLFIVSRFREEIAEGYDTEAAVRRTMMTSGRTVVFSAVIIVASSVPLLLFPQGFLKSITYAIIASVMLAAILSITVLSAALAILGPNVDALGVRTLLRVPFLRNWKPMNWWLNWLADRLQKTKTRDEVEKGFWGKLVNRVMKRPAAFAIPIVLVMIVLITPLGGLALGGISEKYLPPDNSVRQAQEAFDRTFPGFRTEPLTMVIESTDGEPVTDDQVAAVRNKAMEVPGFIDPDNDPEKMWQERPYLDGATKDPSVRVIQNGLENRNDAAKKLEELRALSPTPGVTISVGGTPALEQDSIQSLFDKLPVMVLVLIVTTTVLMFLAFGSVVLPIKAALMSALTLGSTMGILTWMFVDGHGSGVLNYTPQPLMAPMIGLIIAVIWGLSTDYEVFLVSRMVEARERGMSTAEAIRIGTATTGRLITGAALILAVVAGAFVFSDLVMMKYLAFGLLIALLLDATIIRMFLVPAIMKMLGDDCWWAPRWMKRIQVKIGLGETHLPDERKRPSVTADDRELVGASQSLSAAPVPERPRPPHDPTHPAPAGGVRPRPTPPGPQVQPAPGAEATTRIPTAAVGPVPGESDAPTTRFSSAKNAVRNAVSSAVSTPTARPSRPPQPAGEREIESWLGELRGKPGSGAMQPPVQPPSAEPTRNMGSGPSDATTAIPTQRPDGPNGSGSAPVDEPDETATRAIPVAKPAKDSDAATEKLNARGDADDKSRQRRGGGVSAQDLLRREGRKP